MIVRLKRKRYLMPVLPRSLSLNREYRVLAIEADSYRLLSGDEPCLYEPVFFAIIDPTEPEDWREEFGDEGERYTRPVAFESHTWEAYFDHDAAARRMVGAYLDRCAPCFWEVAPHENLTYAPNTRIGILDRLLLVARPDQQVGLKNYLGFDYEMTASVLTALTNIVPIDLRSNEEREAVVQVDCVAERIWSELMGWGPGPSIEDFVNMPQSAELVAAATEALRVLLPDSYLRFLGKPSDSTPIPPSADDLFRARAMSVTSCPRRYCWWWHSQSFDWKMPVAEGCTYLESEYVACEGNFAPCSRCETSSAKDLYEEREHLLEHDGFVATHFRPPKERVDDVS